MISEYKRVASGRPGRGQTPADDKASRRIVYGMLFAVISGVWALGLGCGGKPWGSPDTEDGPDAGGVSSPQTPAPSEPAEENCVNGKDDDGDGVADCADTDCKEINACAAPPLDQSAPSNTAEMVAFLYTGTDPVQKEVDPTIFEPERIAVLRGQVFDQTGEPLAGVRVTMAREAVYGYTETDANGRFDLVINGGGGVTVQYEKAGFLRAQRTVDTAWQQFRLLPEVVLVERSPVVTEIATDVDTVQVAQGSRVEDESGVRQVTLLFPAGLKAHGVDANGQTIPLTKLSVRATEYTVGEHGPAAMPGTLPDASAYTFAVEFSVDEADEHGATTVEFNQPVGLYVDNFLGFPVGEAVPMGYYDHGKSQWIPSANGIVLAVVDTADGVATIDLDGDGVPEDEESLAALGIDQGERETLAVLYEPGQTLWRAPIPHFTPWDCNWPYGLPDGAIAPPLGLFDALRDSLDRPCRRAGSIIHCENQALAEIIDIPATPLALLFQSDRTSGDTQTVAGHMPLFQGTVHSHIKAVVVDMTVAGRRYTHRYDPTPNLQHTLHWDRRDAYGRTVQGRQTAEIRVSYEYKAVYNRGERFGNPGSAMITPVPTRQRIVLSRQVAVQLGAWTPQPLGFGGWHPTIQHTYNPGLQIFYSGNGQRRSAQSVTAVVKPVASELALDLTYSLLSGPDGSLYVSRRAGEATEIVRIAPDGSHALVNSVPYVTAYWGMALAPDDTLYVTDTARQRVIAYGPDGSGRYVAGGGSPADGIGDGGLATEAKLQCPCRVALDLDGSVYITEQGPGRVRRVDPSGIISTLATLAVPRDIAVDPQGMVYVAHSGQMAQISRIRPDGTMDVVATGTGHLGLTLGPNGTLYALGSDVVHQVHATGELAVIAGGGALPVADGAVATSVSLAGVVGLTRGPDDALYFLHWDGEPWIYQLTRALPGLGLDTLTVPSDDGAELYVFDNKGHHLETRDALTGVTLLAFAYDAQWRLTAVIDRDGLKTEIQRNADGLATAIIGPYGQRTELEYDHKQRLMRVRDSENREASCGYDASDRLVEMRDFRGGLHTYRYGSDGRLESDTGPTGFVQSLARNETKDGYEVAVTTTKGRVTRYRVEEDGKRRTTTLPSGLSGAVVHDDAVIHRRAPDGTVTQTQLSPDPRFGMQAPYARQATITTPNGRTLIATSKRVAERENSQDLLSLVRLIDEHTVLGHVSKTVFDRNTWTIEHISPEGRRITIYLDAQGRPSEVHRPGLAPVQNVYDTNGRLTSVRQGSDDGVRETDFAYDDNGFLSFRTDALKQVYEHSTDLVGRVLWTKAPDQTTSGFAYDAHNNITAITPPGRPSHSFQFDAADLPLRSEPPVVDGRATITAFHYDKDLALQRIDLADDRRIEIHYDGAGRIGTISSSLRDISNIYSPTTGHLTDIAGSDGNGIHFERDGPLLLVESWTGDVAGSVSRDYDDAFRMASIAASGVTDTGPVTFAYDGDDLLTQAGPLSITRDLDNGFVRATQVGAVTTALDFNEFAEPIHARATCNGAPLYEADFLRDALARIDLLTETVLGTTRSVDYGYNAVGRVVDVVSVQGGDPERNYDYDDNGNRFAVTENGDTIAAEYDAQDRLLRYGATEYIRSAVGDRVGKFDRITGAATGYDVDEFGNLQSVTLPDGTLVEYIVDSLNRRIGKRVNGELQYGLLYADGLRPIARLSPSGVVEAIYIYATLAHAPDLIIEPGGNVYRIIHDHVGSPRLVVHTDTCEVVQRLEHDEFGRVLLDTNPGFSPFGFAGGLYDPDTGLVRFGARDYDAEIGRWTSKDPAGFGGGDTNLYAYAGSDPVNYVDPNGEIAFLLPLAWAIAKGAMASAAIDGGMELATQLIQNGGDFGCVDWGDVGASAGTGAAMGVAGRGLSAIKGLRAARGGGGAKPLLGKNPRNAKGRTNTDLPGGRATAKSIFRNQTKGQKVTTHKTKDGGMRRRAEDGTQIRMNKDGTTRVDLPDRGSKGKETIHID